MSNDHINPPEHLREGEEKLQALNEDRPFEYERSKMSYQEDKWFFWVRVSFLIFSSLLTLAIVSIFIWHLITPTSWRWLQESDLARIKDVAIAIIVGLVMSGATTFFFKNKK